MSHLSGGSSPLCAAVNSIIFLTCREAPKTLNCYSGQLGIVAEIHVHETEQLPFKRRGQLREEVVADIGGIDTQHLQPGWLVGGRLWNI